MPAEQRGSLMFLFLLSGRRPAFQELSSIRSQPEKNPDGIYQYDKLVGTVVAPITDLASGNIKFSQIKVTTDFNKNKWFQYREYRMQDCRFDGPWYGGKGAGYNYYLVTCQIAQN